MSAANVYDAIDVIVRANKFPTGGPPLATVARALINSDNTAAIVAANGQVVATVPTSDPHVMNAIYSNSGVLTLSAG